MVGRGKGDYMFNGVGGAICVNIARSCKVFAMVVIFCTCSTNPMGEFYVVCKVCGWLKCLCLVYIS